MLKNKLKLFLNIYNLLQLLLFILSGKYWKVFKLLKCLYREKNYCGNTHARNNSDINGNFSDVSDGNDVKNLAELCSSALWKVEYMNDKIGYLAEISKKWRSGLAPDYLQLNEKGQR